MQSECQVVAEEGRYHSGQLADLVKKLVERVMAYMRQCFRADLMISRVALRHYQGQRSFPAHRDHTAYATAVCDLTPREASGLYVYVDGERCFPPLRQGDVVAHGWQVRHGVRMKQGHERMSLIIWTRPPGAPELCGWYLEAAARGEPLAAYHLGWRRGASGSLACAS